MNPQPHCALYSTRLEFSSRVASILGGMCRTQTHTDSHAFEKHTRRMAPGLVIIDLEAPDVLRHIEAARSHNPDLLIIVLGDTKSILSREAEALGVYAVENADVGHKKLRSVAGHALSQIKLQSENQNLREQTLRDLQSRPPTLTTQISANSRSTGKPIVNFSRLLRHLDNVDALLESIVEGVSTTALVSRVGVFMRNREDGIYRLASGIRCLPDSTSAEYSEEDALVQWLERNACQVSRTNLEHILDVQYRLLLKEELDLFGAEVVIPLQGRHNMLGWILLGNRSTGIPFSESDLEEFMLLADHISISLENAHLYEEVAIQKTMAETLLHSIQTGICAINMDHKITGINRSAEDILGVTHQQVFLENTSILGSKLSDILLRALDEGPQGPSQWTDPNTQKILEVESRALQHDGKSSGAVALLRDVTDQKTLQEKQDRVERALFWNDLAASMSHEIRNPLVAIKTFAQLLPDRYDDPEFRAEFSGLVTAEVDRLNGIIEQIDGFAHPDELQFTELNLPDVILAAVDAATSGDLKNGTNIKTSFAPNLPKVRGDRQALIECFGHLVRNSLEALGPEHEGQIQLTAKRRKIRNKPDRVTVTIEDDGPGIPTTIQEKLFSPFCTTKAAGMGLGLPIAKRTLVDHGGEIHLEPGMQQGTRVHIALPASETVPRP